VWRRAMFLAVYPEPTNQNDAANVTPKPVVLEPIAIERPHETQL